MADPGERVPIRLVKENGETIALDATSIDMVVERIQSNFGIPLFDAKKFAIDLNQAAVAFEIQGVFTDDEGQEGTSQAKATIDFYQHQQMLNTGDQGKGEKTSSRKNYPSMGNEGEGSGHVVYGAQKPKIFGIDVFQNWHKRYIELPVGYWLSLPASIDNPVKSGLQAWFKADAITGVANHATVPTWTDSSGNGLVATAVGTPAFTLHGDNGQPFVRFIGTDHFSIPYDAALHSNEFTIFAVATTENDNSAFQSIITGREGATDEGFALYHSMGGANDEVRLTVYDSGSDNIESGNGTVTVGAPTLISATMDDTGGGFHTGKLYLYGEEKDSDTTMDYNDSDAATTFIGSGGSAGTQFHFQGRIYEIVLYNRVLTQTERQQVEGYLARKYNIPLTGENGGVHPFHGNSFSYDQSSVLLAFDVDSTGSIKEPFGYANRTRVTDMVVSSFSNDVITLSAGNPQQWFEVTNSPNRHYRISFKPTSGGFRGAQGIGTYAKVLSVTATTITIAREGPFLNPPQLNDVVYMEPNPDFGSVLSSSSYSGASVVVTMKNAGHRSVNGGSVGPTFPVYEDGVTARTQGASLTRTDEYIAFLVSNLLSSSTSFTDRPVNAAGDTSLDKVFTTAIKEANDGSQSRVEITQVHATSLGRLGRNLRHTLGRGNVPLMLGFTGGKSGKKVKSAGDKVQDLLGILSNSNNYVTAHRTQSSTARRWTQRVTRLVTQVAYSEANSGDYITALQIPYNSLITKGDSSLDTEVAQRNFFLTTESRPTAEKMSIANSTHASRNYAPWASHASSRNGIHGIVTDFAVNRDAEMKAYEFSLKFIAADIII